jgi:hypothetical protein
MDVPIDKMVSDGSVDLVRARENVGELVHVDTSDLEERATARPEDAR